MSFQHYFSLTKQNLDNKLHYYRNKNNLHILAADAYPSRIAWREDQIRAT